MIMALMTSMSLVDFGFLKIIEKYPELNYYYNSDWKKSKSLASFYKSNSSFNDSLIVSYSDVVFKRSALKKIFDNENEIVITFDSKWKNRYEGRTKKFLDESEKVFKCKKSNKLRISNGIKNQDEIIIGESVGIFYIPIHIVKNLKLIIESNFKLNQATMADLLTHLCNKFSYRLIDIEGQWAEMDSVADLNQFKFETKANTLQILENKVKKSIILPQIKCTINEIKNDLNEIVSKIQLKFPSKRLIVRSSALNEDTINSSMAGKYESVLDVNSDVPEEIIKAINFVKDSYDISKDSAFNENQIFIQPLVENVKLSGVIFTRDLETNAPYITINYDLSEKTDSITSGSYIENERTFIYSKYSENFPKNPDLVKIIEGAIEIEEITSNDSLDIEFAIANDELYILQVRPIASSKNSLKVFDIDVKSELLNIKSFLKKMHTTSPKLVGKRTIYGIMPDWNPAEIIGINPNPLALDLYMNMITNKIWPSSRKEVGYRDVSYHPGLISLSGKPYIDVRMSFNTFTPNNIDDKTAEKLINYYINKLSNNSSLHDKVEFEICLTSYDFKFDSRMKELHQNGFSKSEILKISEVFKNLTSDIVNEKNIRIKDQIDQTKLLENKRNEILSSDIPIQDKIVKIIEDCKTYGTYPFSIMARFGFVASILFRSLRDVNVISKDSYDKFFKSINTVAKEFINDLSKLTRNEISKDSFLKVYGHLRPGTYDVRSKTYKENFEDYVKYGDDDSTYKNEIYSLCEKRYRKNQ